jgi:ABC-type uncharacterized transport system involved in gliding motility auxiliary subunit
MTVAAVGAAVVILGGLLGRRQLADVAARRSTRMGAGALVGSVAMLAVVLVLGALAIRHHYRVDLTQGQVHTLAPQTLKLLDSLKQPVTAYAFFRQAQPGRSEAENLLEQYHYQNREFRYQFIDPDTDPGLAKKYQVRDYGTVVLTAGERSEHVKNPEEQTITNAMIRVIKTEHKTVYFLTGHGELSLDDKEKGGLAILRKAVEDQNYLVKPLVLLTSPAVPEDAAVVVAAGPKKPLTEQEKERLAAYLARGGGLLLMLDPEFDAGLSDWLAARGVKLGNDIVLDQASRLFNMSPAVPLALEYGQHEITKTLQGVYCYFPIARSVTMEAKAPQGMTGVNLARTSQTSWGETDLKALEDGQAEFDKDTDAAGPMSLAVAVKMPGKLNAPQPKPAEEAKPEAEGEQAEASADKPAKADAAKDDKPAPEPPKDSQMVVVGDSDFANNGNLDQAGNRDLALGAISFLAEEEDLVAVTPRQRAVQPMLLQPFQARLIFWLPVVIVPLIFAVLGVVVYIKRRRRVQ